MTWDEAFYYGPFQDVAAWTGLLFSDPGSALSSEGIHAGWFEIHELPPVVKWLGAATVSLGGSGWTRLAALRIFPALAFGGSLALLYLIAGRITGSYRWAWLGPAIYALHPRVLGHAQIAATETVFAFVNLLVIWVAMHDLRKWRWKAALAGTLGLALATKVNGIVLIAVILFWLPTRHLIDPGLRRRSADWKDTSLSMGLALVAAPLAAWAIWPWMWDDTVARIAEYRRFIAEHAHQGVWYFGEKWNFDADRLPVTYPLFIAHLTAPAALLALFWTGTIAGLTRLAWRRGLPAHAYLAALATLAPFLASSLPGTPKYDGARLFFPVFSGAALLTVIGLFWLARWIRKRWRKPPAFMNGALIAAGVFLILAVPLSRPSVDYYNLPVQLMTKGRFPFEQTYWGNAFNPRVVEDLNEMMPPDARVKTRAFQGLIFSIYQDWGVLRGDIVFDGPPPYDAHLIHTRRGFWGQADWAIYSMRDPLAGWGEGPQGEPLIYLYDGRPPGQ